MYIALLIILLAIAGALVLFGYRNKHNITIYTGLLVGITSLAFFGFMDFWGEVLWFEATGYAQRFWVEFGAKAGFSLIAGLLGWLLVFVLTINISGMGKNARRLLPAVGALLVGLWGYSKWEIFLKFWYQSNTGITDPILGKDVSFYLFSLPLYDIIYQLLFIISVISGFLLANATLIRLRKGGIELANPFEADHSGSNNLQLLFINAALLIFVLAWGKFLNRYHLMYSNWGTVNGPGWADVHIRLPAYGIVAALTALTGIAILIAPLRERIEKWSARRSNRNTPRGVATLTVSGIFIAATWFLALAIIPGIFQWLRVQPNEITFEKPFIAHNIEFTRKAFKLDNVEERQFPASGNFSQEMVREKPGIFENIRLWDWRALDAVYKQFQEIRLYYEFVDVDIDRYTIGDAYRQVMISAREMELANIPRQSQTFVNTRFKYTHGYGITMTNVSDFTEEGLPNLLIKDIPPQTIHADLAVKRPQIYYGELTKSHVIVNTDESEFDYPSGEKNVYTQYSGKGGVLLSNFWRKFLFGWKFDGTLFFLSEYPTHNSRIMFHRQIQQRVRKLAPFLQFDDDPYIVLAGGRLYWMIDAYTTSS